MPFLALRFALGSLDAEAAEAACFEAGALSVTLSDAADQPIFEPTLGTTPLWANTELSALFPAEAQPSHIRALLQETLSNCITAQFEVVQDRQWEREWLKDFHPMRFGRRLWICPHGQDIPAADAADGTSPGAADIPVIVRLDPGLAFGTGTHPTTAMCLEWLDGLDLHNADVIDYGCGSGILAIAALKLGANRALGIDLDPQALLATRDNAARNEVAGRITTAFPSEISTPPFPPHPSGRAASSVLIANILATPLIELAPTLHSLLKPGGRIALSGILEQQSQAVTAAYMPWFDMTPFASRKGTALDSWVCLQGVRR